MDGTNDYVEVCSTCLNFMAQRGVFTASFWMMPNSLSTTFNIFDQSDRANANGAGIALTSSDSNFYFGIRNGGGSWINYVNIPTSNLNVSRWQHVAFVGDGSSTKAYLNGNFFGASAADFSTITPSYSSKIGKAHAAGEFYNGYLDEFVIVNRTLSPDEVRELYLGGVNRTINGKWHRVASVEGLQSMSFNLTDKDNDLSDYDRRAIRIVSREAWSNVTKQIPSGTEGKTIQWGV